MSCPDCFSGHVHSGEPRGNIVQLHGLETYVAEPKDGRPVKGIIVIIPDAFGIELVNNKLLADHYADKSDYKVYLPDFMLGRSAPAWLLDSMRVLFGPGNYLQKPYHIFWGITALVPWIYYNRPGVSVPIVKGFFEQLRKAEGSTLPIGAAGFCWGAKHLVTMSQGHQVDGKPLFDAGFVAHPSMLDVPADIKKIQLPISFALGEDDSNTPKPKQEELEAVVVSLPEPYKGEVKVYPKAAHGFAIRADVKYLDVASQAEEAEQQCLDWLNKHFKI